MTSRFPSGCVVAVSVSVGHDFSRLVQQHIRLLTGLDAVGTKIENYLRVRAQNFGLLNRIDRLRIVR
jgi:hypothetical protein